MTSEQLRRYFEEPGAHLLLDLDFNVIDAGPEYLRTTYTKREDIVGRSVFEIVDDSTHGNLRVSLTRAVETGLPDKMDVARYDILRRTGEGEETERAPRWLRVTNIPVFAKGKISGIVQRIEDVTLEVTTARKVDAIRRANYVLYGLVVLIVALLAVAFTGLVNDNRTAIRQASRAIAQSRQVATVTKASAAAACKIQARGLIATHELVGVIEGFHALLTLPVTAQQKQQRAQIPRPLLKREIALVAHLNGHLERYDMLESKQPATRRCP